MKTVLDDDDVDIREPLPPSAPGASRRPGGL